MLLFFCQVALYSAAGQNRGNQVTALLPQRPAQRPDINFKVDGVNIIQSVNSPCKGGMDTQYM